MAGASLFALLDDIASILDDVATMTKVAAKKTAGVLGDDLALNAQQVAGVRAERELPVVWAVAKGSALNKLILVPLALAISAWAPWAVMPLLVIGGAYLCYEGVEKLVHSLAHRMHRQADAHQPPEAAESGGGARAGAEPVSPETLEREKIRGAIRTDFVLSAEIVVIALGTVAGATLAWQVSVLSAIAALMTVGVYGLVAGIVKLDDAGFYLLRVSGNAGLRAAFGRMLLAAAPKLMRTLSVVGTAAMFMVGGGILTHGIPFLHHAIDDALWNVAVLPVAGPALAWLTSTIFDMMVGVLAGAALLAAVAALTRLMRRARA